MLQNLSNLKKRALSGQMISLPLGVRSVTFRAVVVAESRTIAAVVVPQKILLSIWESLVSFTVTEETFIRKMMSLKFEIRRNVKA